VCIVAISALTLHHGRNYALLHGRWALEAVVVDTADKLCLESHIVEGIDGSIVIEFNVS
jgi:hypothetical protein